MDDKTREFEDFEESKELISSKNEDVPTSDMEDFKPLVSTKEEYILKLADDSEEYLQENMEKCEDNDTANELLSLDNSTVTGNESQLTIEINKFAEQFVEPIVKEAIAMHKSETEDDEAEVRGESGGDKKSDKSSSDDGFEHVKKEEVEKEEPQDNYDNRPSEADEVRRELEDVVFQEELRLESASEDVLPGTIDSYESDDGLCHDLPDEDVAPSEILEEQGDIAEVKETIREEVTDIMHSACSIENNTSETYDDEPTLDTVNENEYILDEPSHDMHTLESTIPDESDTQFHVEHKPETQFHDDHTLDTPLHDDTTVNTSFQDEPYLYDDQHTQSSLIKPEEHDINGKCIDIINWAHPVSSAIAFFILMFVELGLMMEYSIISLLAYSGLLLMLASFLYKMAVNFRLLNTQSYMNCVITFNKGDVEYCVDVTLRWVDYLHKEIKSIAYVESYTKNIKVFIMLWILTYVGQMFNLQSLILIGSLLLFSMPLVYNKFETEINEATENVRAKIRGVTNKVKSKCQRLIGCR